MLLQNLTELRELYLDGVDISAQGSEWCQAISSSLPELRILSLRGCSLSGPLHPSLSKLHFLSVVQLDGNSISSTLPNFFANFSYLITLSLIECGLQGSVPKIIFQIPTLEILDLSFNVELTGTIPQFHRNASLRTISLQSTNFSGPLPNSIGNISMLSKIDLRHCGFTGPIPSTMVTLTGLIHVDLSWNFFNGSIPPFYMSKKLQSLLLSGNSLSGSIPQSLFSLPSLETLRLSYNQLSGRLYEFPTLHFSSIVVLDLSSNRLEGQIPESFFTLESLDTLDLSHNFFNGTVELEKFQRLSNLTVLDLSYNNLSVDTSITNTSLSTFPQLFMLALASCNLQNFSDLQNLHNLGFLDLSNNRITGEVPNWIWEIGNGALRSLNLSLNLLVGLQKPYHIPNRFDVLDLHSNLLQVIDLSVNKLCGTIPPCLAKQLVNDYGRYRFFSGDQNYWGTVIVIVKGAEREFVKILTIFTVIDFSCNNFQGEIPDAIGDLRSLYTLNISHNTFTGTIPKALDSFKGNTGLCDFPLNISCRHTGKIDNVPPSNPYRKDEAINWDYVSVAVGYVVGLGSILWLLFFCRSFRHKFNDQLTKFLKRYLTPKTGEKDIEKECKEDAKLLMRMLFVFCQKSMMQ
ncbi:UNVERIFIED_CONTAM: Receptor-like protein 34 [Sesamum latifolium]|uniref:Receptor-like protein 34 n=1 Tax=Sesamum latifolium TaxID=2727402 RepID=A0AAW2Y0A6_9LAMI